MRSEEPKKKPRVSVCITTHDRPTIERAIRSVLKQDFKDYELIVVDDCSDTKMPYVPVNARVIRNPKNLGSTKSLNIGLRIARGEYIAILDDDDFWTDPKKLSKQVSVLDEHPEVMVVGTNATVNILDSRGNTVRIVETHYPETDTELRNAMLPNNSIAHVTAMYRRGLLYDESLPRSKDWDMMARLGKMGKLANLPDNTTTFCERRDVKLKARDSLYKLKVVWRYRNDYPGFWGAFLSESPRFAAFSILSLLTRKGSS